MGSHQSPNPISHDWLTPPNILEALGDFDLDPCAAPEPRPWPTAATHWTDNTMNRKWFGRIWLNPPYGSKEVVGPWMRRMANHGNGIALIFARTETDTFFETVWEKAQAILFLKGRLNFYRINGSPGLINSGAPSVLIAYGDDNAEVLRTCGLSGKWLAL